MTISIERDQGWLALVAVKPDAVAENLLLLADVSRKQETLWGESAYWTRRVVRFVEEHR